MKTKTVLSSVRFSAAMMVFLFCSGVFSVDQTAKQKKTLRPLVSVIQKDGKRTEKRCFRDTNRNGFCDNGSEQQWKCKNNCRLAPADDKKKTEPAPTDKQVKAKEDEWAKKLPPPCSGCPLAGNCSGACAALFRTENRLLLSV